MEEVYEFYGGRYLLLEENRSSFINRKSLVKVQCIKHGIFEKRAQKLLSGQSCWPCRIEKLSLSGRLPGGYCERTFLENPDLIDKPATLYYLLINSEIYKIGITTMKVSDRIKSLRYKAGQEIKSIQVMDTASSTLGLVYAAEQNLLDKFWDKRLYTDWSTELFKEDILNGKSLLDLL